MTARIVATHRTPSASGRYRPAVGSTSEQIEAEVHRVGAELADAFPSPARHPMKALDARAMELAAADLEIRAALFRFVDVVPACRSMDDLARHLAGFLDELPDGPPPVLAAIKVADTRAGRAALGAAAAAGVKHMAHRFIVGETPGTAVPVLRRLWARGIASSVDLLGEATVTEPEADAYAARCADALRSLSAATARWPARPTLARTSPSRSPRSRPCCGPMPPSSVSATPLAGSRRCSARRRRSARMSTSTRSRSTRARPCSGSCSRS